MSGEVPSKDEEIGYLKPMEVDGKNGDGLSQIRGWGNLYLRPRKSTICKNLGNLVGNQLEFIFYNPVKLDYFAIVKNKKTATVENLDLISANHNLHGNVLASLINVDNDYAEILPGEKIDFTFRTNSNGIGNIRYILKSTGRYEEGTTKFTKQFGANLNSEEIIPGKTGLIGNYPNPFNPQTTIKYSLSEEVKVKISIYNMLGQRVKILVDEYQSAGYKTIVWDGLDEHGHPVSSGVYISKFVAGDYVQSRKMALLR